MAGAEMRAALDLVVHCLHDLGVTMSEQQRAVSAEIIDIAIAVDVPFPRPFGPRNIETVRLDIARIMGNAARKQSGSSLGVGRRTRGCPAIGGNDRRVRRQGVRHTRCSSAWEVSRYF